MTQSPSVALALAAGFVSFVSPCCLPLVPGYLAAISGGTTIEAGSRPSARLMLRALVFVGTFSLVFILLGLSATALGSLLQGHQILLRQIAGVAIVLMGLLFLASAFVLTLNRDWRPAGLIERAGRGGPVIAGLAFAIAWTPCVGPTLGAILGLASTQESTAQGGLLLAVYSLGLAVPFLLAAAGFGWAQRSFGWIRRHYVLIQVVSGLILVAMGVLVFTGELFRLNLEAQRLLESLGLNFFQSVTRAAARGKLGHVKTLFSAILVGLALVLLGGCGGSGATSETPTTPPTGSEPIATAPVGSDIRAASADLCRVMRETIGSLPSPKDGDDDDFESAVLGAQEAYLDGISQLPVEDDQKETLERFLISQQELFDAQATARKSENPEESGVEGGAGQVDATVESEKLAKQLGIEGCAAI